MAAVDLVIKNGKFVTPLGIVSGGIAINDGKIVSISHDNQLPDANEVIDAKHRVVIPGVIDPEAHPGHSKPFEQDLRTESQAAIAYGVTTWGIQNPITRIGRDFKEVVGPEDIVSLNRVLPEAIEIGKRVSFTDFFYTPMIETDKQSREIPIYAAKYGVTSFKFYGHCKMINIANQFWFANKIGLATGFDDGTVFVAMENVAKLSPPGIIAIHCENYEISRILINRLREQGKNDLAAWSAKTPPFVEAHQVVGYSYLAKVTGAQLYIQHVTTEETVNQIRNARNNGVTIFGQTAPAYLSLTDDSLDTGWKLNVPIRDRTTLEYLWRALADGLIDCVGSDHVSHFPREVYEQEKRKPVIWDVRSGFSSRVESLMPVMLSEGVNKRKLSLQRLVQVTSENPARIFGLYPRKGAIQVGSDADVVILDLKKTAKLSPEMVFSSTGWSIYEGKEFVGWPVMTLVRGRVMVAWPEGTKKPEILAKSGSAEYLARGQAPT